jgi:hypothetical protein
VTAWQPDAYDRQRASEAEIITAKCPGWLAVYGYYTRRFWAYGAPDGQPIAAGSASELLGLMRAAQRSQAGPYYEPRPPGRYLN